ncbi:F-box only protein 21 [Armadillidium nasatum]|uniref:F-box only protein 21 n=1 Tax=Armadillidium nasatum TaxID=96803 RepID=A0A5N5T9Y3_9CRUS|nr:F-box only protein 21 [Armadillidium nasatum]
MLKFDQIPDEILLKIFYNTSVTAESLISLSNVCQRFRKVCSNEEMLWKSKFKPRWPLAWKKNAFLIENSSQPINWKKEVEDSVEISNKFQEILNSLIHLANYLTVAITIVPSIFDLFKIGEFGTSVVLNEFRRVIKTKRIIRRGPDLMLLNAKTLLYHVNYYLVTQEMKEFLSLPPERKCFEKGAYHLAKGLNPDAFLAIEYEDVSLKLDKLALDVQLYLRSVNPSHPAASIELISPEDFQEYAKWSGEETNELIHCLNYVLCLKYNAGQNNDIGKIYFHQLLANKKKDIFFSIIYMAVSHRLGIPFSPIRFDECTFLSKWKSEDAEYVVIAPGYTNGYFWLNVSEYFIELFNQYEYNIEIFLLLLARSKFDNRENIRGYNLFPRGATAAGMILIIQSFLKNLNKYFYSDVFKFCLEEELHLDTIIDTCDKLLNLDNQEESNMTKIRSFSTEARQLLAIQQHKVNNKDQEENESFQQNRLCF